MRPEGKICNLRTHRATASELTQYFSFLPYSWRSPSPLSASLHSTGPHPHALWTTTAGRAMAGRGGAARPNGPAAGNKICQFKLVLLGESAVGKSSLVLRFVKGQFHEYQESTIGGEWAQGSWGGASGLPKKCFDLEEMGSCLPALETKCVCGGSCTSSPGLWNRAQHLVSMPESPEASLVSIRWSGKPASHPVSAPS